MVTQLRRLLPVGWMATLRAVDGARTNDVVQQVASLPPDASHLVLSAGGNDALSHGDLLEQRMVSAAQLFGQLADAAAEFESRYRRLVDQLAARRLPLVGSVGAIRTSKGESPVIHTAPNIRSQSL